MSLLKGSLLFASGTLFSRITGLLRESVIAGVFGANVFLDAFFIANRIPNMLRELLAEGALGASFTRVYTRLCVKEPQRAAILGRDACTLGLCLLLVFSVLGLSASSFFVKAMTFTAENTKNGVDFFNQTVGLTRVLFPFIGFMILGAMFSGILHQRGRFFLSSVSSVALNLGYILGATLLVDAFMFAPSWVDSWLAERSILALAVGVLVGGALQMLIQWWGAGCIKASPIRQVFPLSRDVKSVMSMMLPMMLAASAGQINVLVNTNFAATLEGGAVSWLTYAFRVLQLPIGLFAVGVGTVSLTDLSRESSTTALEGLSKKLQDSFELISWLMIFCLAFFVVNRREIIDLLYFHGKFSEVDVQATSQALFYYSFGLVGYGLVKVLSSFYYAINRTSFAMKVSLASIMVNFVANALLVKHFGFEGLSLAFSIVISVNAIALTLGLASSHVRLNLKKLLWTFLFLFFSFCLAWCVQNYFQVKLTNALVEFPHKMKSFVILGVNSMAAVMIFVGLGSCRYRISPQQMLKIFKRRR